MRNGKRTTDVDAIASRFVTDRLRPRWKINMKAIFVGIIVLLIPWMVTAQGNTTQLSDGVAYSNTVPRFRYQPPSEMQDVTKRAEAEIRAHAQTLHSSSILGMLLAMTSGPDETVPGWHALTIEMYPRKAFSDLDDAAARQR